MTCENVSVNGVCNVREFKHVYVIHVIWMVYVEHLRVSVVSEYECHVWYVSMICVTCVCMWYVSVLCVSEHPVCFVSMAYVTCVSCGI